MAGIGFFAPLPLALMLPFMAGQSMLMGDAFGKSYQYGKRKISAMSNEDFNKLTAQQLGKEIVADYNAIIPSLQQAVQASSNFQSMIIQELAKIVRSLPTDIVTGFQGDSNPVQTIATQVQKPSDQIDYGKIALATIKILLGPIGAGFLDPQTADASLYVPPPSSTFEQHADRTLTEEGPENPFINPTFASMNKTQLLTAQSTATRYERDQINYYLNLLKPKVTTSPPSAFKQSSLQNWEQEHGQKLIAPLKANAEKNAYAKQTIALARAGGQSWTTQKSQARATETRRLQNVFLNKQKAYYNWLTQQRNSLNSSISARAKYYLTTGRRI